MQKTVRITVKTDPFEIGLFQIAVEREVDQGIVRPIRDDHANVHSPKYRQLKRIENGIVRYEVGCSDPDAFFCGIDDMQEHQRGGLEFIRRSGGDYQNICLSFF